MTQKWSAAAHSKDLRGGTTTSLSLAEQGMSSSSDSTTTDLMTPLQQDITRLLKQLQDLITNRLVPAAVTPSQRAVGNRYREILHDLRADYDKSCTALQRTKERHELLLRGNNSSGDGGDDEDPGMASLLRERNHINNSMNMAHDVLGQAENVRSDLRWQGRSLRTTGGVLGQLTNNIPGLNYLVEQIRRKRSRDDKIVAGVIASCIVFSLWYWFG